MTRWRRALGVLLVGSAVLAACGGGDGGEETSTPTTVASRASEDGGGKVEGSTGALTAADCTAANSSLADQYGGTAEAMANLTAGLQAQLAALEGYAEKAPSDMKDDIRLMADAFSDFIEAQASISVAAVAAGVEPPPDTMAKLLAATVRIRSGEFIEAAGRLSAWLDTECGR